MEGRESYEKAGAQGDASARFTLMRDIVKARKWLEKAAAQGNKSAKQVLTKLNKDTKSTDRAA